MNWVMFFSILTGILAICTAIAQSIKEKKDNAERLADKTEIIKLQKENNSKLQEINSLQNQIINYQSGGDSYPYVDILKILDDKGEENLTLAINKVGKYPLYEVNEITGYVIMPNHLHVLLVYRDTTSSLNTLIGNGKRFMAYEIINRLEQKNETGLLERLKKGVNEKERTKRQLHKVFEPSFDCKKCEGFDFLTQKLDYMHANPVSGKWELVKESIDYLHSSNNFYETGKDGIYKITHYMDLAETADW